MADTSAEAAQTDSGAQIEKHPLQFKWTLWHDPPKNRSVSGDNYAENLRAIASFDTVEDFWAYVIVGCLVEDGSRSDALRNGTYPSC